MCHSNSPSIICGMLVLTYKEQSAELKRPTSSFVLASALQFYTLLLSLSPVTQPVADATKPPFAQRLKQTDAFIKLCKECNGWHLGHDYKTIIIPSFRNHIAWIQGVLRKADGIKCKDGV